MGYEVSPVIEALFIDGKKYEAEYDMRIRVSGENEANKFVVFRVNADGDREYMAEFINKAEAEFFAKARKGANTCFNCGAEKAVKMIMPKGTLLNCLQENKSYLPLDNLACEKWMPHKKSE